MFPQLELPSVRSAHPSTRRDFERIYDDAVTFRQAEAVERVVDEWARRARRAAPSPIQASLASARGRSAQTLAAQFRALFRDDGGTARDCWFDASSVLSDGATKLYAWVDRIDATHYLMQSGSGGQCDLPMPHASFAAAPCAYFNGTTNTYGSTRPASSWSYVHAGTGCEMVGVYMPTDLSGNRSFWSTWASGAHGAWLYSNVGTAGPYFQIATTSGTVILTFSGSAITDLNVPTYLAFQYATADTPDALAFRRGTQIYSGNAGVPITTAPMLPLRMGNLGGSNGFFAGHSRALYCFRRSLNTAEKNVYRSFIQADCGIAA